MSECRKTSAKRFLISSGVGYDANICEEVSRSRLKTVLNKIHLGKLVYVMIGVKQIFAKKTVRAKLYLDDAPVMKLPELFFVVGMNHMYEGGGIPFCPNADPTDGRLDVCLVKGMSRLKLLLAVVLVYFKKHLLFKDITNHRCKKMPCLLLSLSGLTVYPESRSCRCWTYHNRQNPMRQMQILQYITHTVS